MKYGSQLSGRSVPEWSAHNILYEDIKADIKGLTSGGWSEERYKALEGFLFDELSNVALFVKSKMFEIEHRIRTCHDLVESARASGPNGPNEDEQMYQLHRETARLTGDVQKLSRFASVQYTGFRKLIKKYRRHAPTDVMGNGQNLSRFEHAIEDPASFAHIDFTPAVLELSLLYDVIRSGKFTQPSSPAPKPRINQLLRFDADMLRVPANRSRKWWVHIDHLVEVKVLLLQHTTIVSHSSAVESTATDMICLDTPALNDARLLRDPGQVRWCRSSGPVLFAPTGGMRGISVAELTTEQLQHLLTDSVTPADLESSMEARVTLGWVLSRGVRPVVRISSQRSRFQAPDLYVSLDTATRVAHDEGSDKTVNVTSNGTTNGIKNGISDNKTSYEFPYAVLEVRALESSPLIAELDQSPLTFSVSDSFSLYAYALAKLRPREFAVSPGWLATLENGYDIRRPTETLTTHGPTPHRSRLHLRGRKPSSSRSHTGILLDPPTQPRYWNEFDDGDEAGSTGDPFEVVVDVFDQSQRRAAAAERVSRPMWAAAHAVRRHVQRLFGLETPYTSQDDDLSSTSGSTMVDSLEAGQYSPRVGPHEPPDPSVVSVSNRDRALSFLMLLCLTMSVAMTVFVVGVVGSEDIGELALEVQVILVIGVFVAVLLSGAGVYVYGMRSDDAQDWRIQVIVQAVFFTVICFGVGGIAILIAPVTTIETTLYRQLRR